MNANKQIKQTTDHLQQPDAQAAEPTVPTFRRTIGGTTYIVGVHFSKTSKETLAAKVRKLMVDEINNAYY